MTCAAVVDLDREARRARLELGHVVHAQPLAAHGRRLAAGLEVAQEAVELGGLDPLRGAVGQVAAPRPPGASGPRPVCADTAITCGRWRSFCVTRALASSRSVARHVPLVQRDHRRALLLHRHLGDAEVLARHALARRRRPRSPPRRARPPARSAAGRSSRPCRPPWCGAAGPAVSTSTTCRPSNSIRVSIESRVVPATVGHDHALLPEQLVHERGLAHVRPPDQRQPRVSSAASASRSAAARRSGRAGRRCRGPGWPRPASGRPGRAP